VQGVGPQQPRTLVVPFAMLVDDPSLDPEAVTGRGFEADISLDDEDRWVVGQISFASRVLRPKGGRPGGLSPGPAWAIMRATGSARTNLPARTDPSRPGSVEAPPLNTPEMARLIRA